MGTIEYNRINADKIREYRKNIKNNKEKKTKKTKEEQREYEKIKKRKQRENNKIKLKDTILNENNDNMGKNNDNMEKNININIMDRDHVNKKSKETKKEEGVLRKQFKKDIIIEQYSNEDNIKERINGIVENRKNKN